MAPLWTIELFGSLCARGAARTITRFQTRQTGALLAYLAFYNGRAHARPALAESVWPEDPPPVARRKLKVALYSLRGQLEPPGIAAGMVITGSRLVVQLSPETCGTDVAAFESAVRAAGTARGLERAGRLQEAVEQYSGELLPELFDEWVLTERRRLEAAHLDALGELIALLEEAGDLPRAIHWARRAVDADPLHEEAHQALIRLLHAAGRPEAALRQYRDLRQHLDTELGLEPEAASRQLAETIGASRPGQALEPAVFPPTEGAENPAVPIPMRPQWTAALLMAAWDQGRARQRPPATPGERSVPTMSNDCEPPARATAAPSSAVRATLFCSPSPPRAKPSPPPWPPSPPSITPSLPHSLNRPRLAMHAGDVRVTAGEPEGPPLEHVARLLRAARGGQILLSEAAVALLRASAEPAVELIDLGRFRLRNGDPPERLFQLRDPADPAPPQRPDAPPAREGHLPLQLTRFIGREPEIAWLRARVGGEFCRLITLTGPGGTGKSRLALETAARVREEWRGAVWFVPLADLAHAASIAERLRDVLGLPRSPNAIPLEQAVAALAEQPSLLILDNLEHLLPKATSLVHTLVERIDHLAILATSRRRLDLPGEREYPVGPLAVPDVVDSGQWMVVTRTVPDRPDPTTNHYPLSPPWSSSSTAPRPPARTSESQRRTRGRWQRSACGWRGCLSPSSWRRPGPAR